MRRTEDQRSTPERELLDAREMRRVIQRMAVQLLEKERDLERVMLVGIHTRGVPLAERLAAEILALEGVEIPLGALDITFYRDDLSVIGPQPVVKGTDLPGEIEGRIVVLCDDVLFTGRTVRAALDELVDYGRPSAVRLVVLVDRGHRELPIQADVVGRIVPTALSEQVKVGFEDVDGQDYVRLHKRSPATGGSASPDDGDTDGDGDRGEDGK